VAPLREFLKSLKNIGYNGYLSLELFVQDYQDDNPLSIARYGYSKIQNCIGISE
jgi:sugar phosphate isomerase/epimerase